MKQGRSSLFILLVCAVSACKKDNELSSRTQLLIDKKWQLQSLIQSYPGSPDFDFYAHTDTCSKDGYRRFEAPHTTSYDEGPTKCNPNNDQTQIGYWEFSNSDELLKITDPSISDTYTIVELTESNLKMTRTLPQSTGLNLIQTFVYKTIP
jgi:hypothetical protein